MSLIRGKGNKTTELRMIELFRFHGITGWRRGWSILGKPDFVFPKLRLVIFVDGCFWHGCPKHSIMPKNNADFWLQKLTSNRIRDRKVTSALRRKGWMVIRVWEHSLSGTMQSGLPARISKILNKARSEIC